MAGNVKCFVGEGQGWCLGETQHKAPRIQCQDLHCPSLGAATVGDEDLLARVALLFVISSASFFLNSKAAPLLRVN